MIQPLQNRVSLVKGDITKIPADAIVNAANSSLLGGGGVDGAIHRAGGPQILDDCRKIISRIGSCKTGQAVITSAGKLPAKFVIHTVGPVWNGGNNNEAALLASCYETSLQLAVENKCNSVAFPNISTGIYRFPKELAATIAVNTIATFLASNPWSGKVIFVCFDEENFEFYKVLLKEKSS